MLGIIVSRLVTVQDPHGFIQESCPFNMFLLLIDKGLKSLKSFCRGFSVTVACKMTFIATHVISKGIDFKNMFGIIVWFSFRVKYGSPAEYIKQVLAFN